MTLRPVRALIGFFVAALVGGTPLVTFAAALSPAQIAKIDAIANEAMVKQHLPAVAIGVGRNGTLLFARGYGTRVRATKLPANATTMFGIGSITKSFTATSVMLLVERGKVDLDAPVARYLPTVPHAREITVRQLLDQTSGLPDYLENAALYKEILTSTVKARPIADYVGLVSGKPLHFKPGSKWEYSNTNYAILGMLIEKVSGEPYGSFYSSQIFVPQGMTRIEVMTTFPPAGDAAHGYTFVKGAYVPVAPQSMSWGNAAGALASDVGDLIRFDGALFTGKIVTPASLHAMLTPPPNRPMIKTRNASSNLAGGYGFGWVMGHDEGRVVNWHNGGIIGGRAMNAVFPRDGLEIVVLTNVTTASPESTAMKIARMLYAP